MRASPASSTCWSPTACSTCWGMTTTPRTTRRRCASARRLPAGGRGLERRDRGRAVTWTEWEIVIAAVATAFAFFASTWVNAISRISHGRARRLVESEPKRGALLVKLAANPRPYLAGTLLAMLVARVTSVVLIADVLQRTGVPAAAVITIAV